MSGLSLCEGKLVDENFPGFGIMIEQLSKCKDHQLVWQYVDWAMSVDQKLAVEIFTKRAGDELMSERMRVEAIAESIEKYPDAFCLYLEYLVQVKNMKVTLIDSVCIPRLRSQFKISFRKRNTPLN